MMGKFIFTCSILIWVFSDTEVDAVPSLDSPSFNIEKTVNLEATVSCGKGMFQNQQSSTCLSEREGDSAYDDDPPKTDCSACDPVSNTQFSINNALRADQTSEWRSLPKTQGSHLQEINITINVPQIFKVQRISVKAGSTPLPAVWAMEESRDFGSRFKGVRYYVAYEEDCFSLFGVDEGPLCLLRPTFSWKEDENVDLLASRIRLRFFRMWSNFGTNGSGLDYYSLSTISFEGHCDCNGHADLCTLTSKGVLACLCKHNTCGEQCETCCKGYTLDDNGDCAIFESHTNSTPLPLQSSTLESIANSTTSNLLVNATETHVGRNKSHAAIPSENVTATNGGGNSSTVMSSESLTLPTTLPDNNEKSSVVIFSDEEDDSLSQTDSLVPTEVLTGRGSGDLIRSPTAAIRSTVVSTTEVKTQPSESPINRTSASVVTTLSSGSSTNRTFSASTKAIESTVLQTTKKPGQKTGVNMVTSSDDGLDDIATQSTSLATTEADIDEATTESSAAETTNDLTTTETHFQSTMGSSIEKTTEQPNTLMAGVSTGAPVQSTTLGNTLGSIPEQRIFSEATTVESAIDQPTVEEGTTASQAFEQVTFAKEATDDSDIEETTSAEGTDGYSTSAATSTGTVTQKVIDESITNEVTTPATEEKYTGESNTGESTETPPRTKKHSDSASLENATTSRAITAKFPTEIPSTTETITSQKPIVSSTVKITGVTRTMPPPINTTTVTEETTAMSAPGQSTTTEQITSGYTIEETSTIDTATDATPTSDDETIGKEVATEETTLVTASEETSAETATDQPTITGTMSSWTTIETGTATNELIAVDSTDESAFDQSTSMEVTAVSATTTEATIEQASTTDDFTSGSATKEPTRTKAISSYPVIKSAMPTEATTATFLKKTTEVSATMETNAVVVTTGGVTGQMTTQQSTTTNASVVETVSEPASMQATSMMPSPTEATAPSALMAITTEPASVKTTTEPFLPLVETTPTKYLPTPEGITTQSIKTTTEPFPSLVETATKATTEEASTVLISTDPNTIEMTTETTTVKTTTKPTSVKKTTTEPFPPLVETVTEPATERTSTVPFITDPITTVATPIKTTIKPTNVKKTTTVPFPPLEETATKPTTEGTSTVPITIITILPITKEATPVKTTTKPASVKATTERFPPLIEATTEPFPPLVATSAVTSVKTTNKPTTVKTTAASTTSGVLSEEQARIVFGNLPKGLCYCNRHATVDKQCFPTAINKPCICRSNFAGVRCDSCAAGYFNFPICAPCNCNKFGSADLKCDKDTGRCTCKPGFSGRKCSACPLGKFNFPTCTPCECNPSGSYGQICDPYSGRCPCRYGVWGRQCNKCPAGYYNFPNCRWCGCNPLTTTKGICEDQDGGYGYRCLCKPNFKGSFCGECQKGYYDFPICKKCLCSPRGYGSCNELGRCVCDAGYTGSQCDRCANGYYGFPYCRPCNCNTFGSYSTQCNDTTGQCACRPNIRGGRCNRCAKGMVGFPKCVECDCNPDGTRFLPGRESSMCYGSAKYHCLCKSHVVGRTCDRCAHGNYNFSGSNPSGCSACRCSTRGTVSGTQNCHLQNGHCDCKNHVIGAKCDHCRDGYHGIKPHDILGCKACKCDPGGSANRNCFKYLGNCQCVSGVEGKKCNSLSLSRPLYFPTLYQVYVELEGAVLMSNTRVHVPMGADANVFPSFSGTGYAIFPAYKRYAVAVRIPKTRKYRVIFHYALRDEFHTSAKVELFPQGSRTASLVFDVQFPPPNPSEQQTKNLRTTANRRGMNIELQMSKGTWTAVITSHSSILLLDYIVFLPEDYYNAKLLLEITGEPCLLRSSKPEYCDMYTYFEPKGPSLVTLSGDKAYTLPLKGRPDMFSDPRFDLSNSRFSNMALLGGSQPSIGFDISVPETGPHVVMVTYLHPERFTLRAFVRLGFERGQLEILPCKYMFACRQFVMDDNKRPKYFELKGTPVANGIRMDISASAKIAVMSITAIPLAKWSTQYVQPELLCRMYNNSCIPSSYQVPPDSIQLIAFSRRTQDKVTSMFTGAVNPAVVYYVVFHYQQPYSLSKKVEQISIADQVKSNFAVTFRYCPATAGCRIVLGEDDGQIFQFNKGTFTATIDHERRTHLEYILLVPQDSYATNVLELQSTDRVNQFLQNCVSDHFYLEPVQTGRQCREDVFSLTIRFNKEPLPCRCNLLGSKSTFCEQFGGQCHCHANVVGRKCDKCRLGYSGFPRCRRCGCHEVGSVSPTCTSSGRCRCKPGFGGYKCDRCKSSGYYGFPDCKPCACNNLGSLSTFCRSRDGQCQCLRNFQGQKCDECRVGFYDFPSCKACRCNPAGIKLLPGEKNGCGTVNETHCRCKDNVLGDDCDTCKPFHFNLRITNPLGCQACDCNTNGSLGTINKCHETTGQCICKSHVTGRQCGRCKEGYYSLKGPDVFGCKRCSCDAGGSVSQSCNPITGACTCLRGVGGPKCDRVLSNSFYYPTLHQYKIELEDGHTENDRPAYFRHSDGEFPGFSWLGYVVFSQSQNSMYIMVDVPRTSKYQMIFHYMLSRYAPVTALVKFIPTLDSAPFPSGPAREQNLDVRFRSTASWIFANAEFLVVRDNWGDAQQIMLSHGKWKLTIAAPPSDLFVDYLVLLPQEYYRPRNLAMQVSNPCTLSRDDKYCVFFTYPTLKQTGFVTIQAEDNSVVGGIRRNQRAGDIPFRGLLLSGSRNVMSVRMPSTIPGKFVLVASYFHNSDDEGILRFVVTTGDKTVRAKMSILSCRYRFGCRQVAIDDNHDVSTFTANPKEVTTVSVSTRLTVALDFITAIPLSKWDQELLIPVEQCASNGYSCVQTSYPEPTDAVKIEIEDRSSGGDRAPYYIMDRRARLKHLKKGEKTVHVSGTARSGRYYVIVHFYQPNYLSFLGKVVVSGQGAASVLLTFRYCPYVSGCRAVGTSQYREGMIDSVYIGRQSNILISIVIPEDKGVWIDYVMLDPVSSFSSSLLEIKPIDVTQDFIQDCGQHNFYLKESSSKFCLSSAFTITSRFNNGALACDCDRLGSTQTTCQSFGGQCACRPNVIGRACDRCKSGYSGFPHCRKLVNK